MICKMCKLSSEERYYLTIYLTRVKTKLFQNGWRTSYSPQASAFNFLLSHAVRDSATVCHVDIAVTQLLSHYTKENHFLSQAKSRITS